ncbi:hypothetical protein HYX02_05880 [Candidatus Woesearchaeota archaeon]|nr:hypothetical protein [Candidatus Woesearchaeota archaeon]
MVGNIPNFTKIDILRCFLKFGKNIGRQEIAKELGLGEGTTRTILGILKSKKFLDSTKKGHFLSRKGSEMLSQICESVSLPKIVAYDGVYPEFKKAAVLVRNVVNLKEAYKLRDVAVKNSAEGVLILKFKGRLYVPDFDHKQDYKELEKHFELKDNDVLLVAFSNDKRTAENGVLAVAIELNDTLKKFTNDV